MKKNRVELGRYFRQKPCVQGYKSKNLHHAGIQHIANTQQPQPHRLDRDGTGDARSFRPVGHGICSAKTPRQPKPRGCLFFSLNLLSALIPPPCLLPLSSTSVCLSAAGTSRHHMRDMIATDQSRYQLLLEHVLDSINVAEEKPRSSCEYRLSALVDRLSATPVDSIPVLGLPRTTP